MLSILDRIGEKLEGISKDEVILMADHALLEILLEAIAEEKEIDLGVLRKHVKLEGRNGNYVIFCVKKQKILDVFKEALNGFGLEYGEIKTVEKERTLINNKRAKFYYYYVPVHFPPVEL